MGFLINYKRRSLWRQPSPDRWELRKHACIYLFCLEQRHNTESLSVDRNLKINEGSVGSDCEVSLLFLSFFFLFSSFFFFFYIRGCFEIKFLYLCFLFFFPLSLYIYIYFSFSLFAGFFFFTYI